MVYIKYFLGVYYVSYTVLGTGDPTVNNMHLFSRNL